MPTFKIGDHVRRVRHGMSSGVFPRGAAGVVHEAFAHGDISICADADGELWQLPVDDLELVPQAAPVAPPAEPARLTRRIVQRETTVLPNGTVIRTVWFEDGSFVEHTGGSFWFESGPIPQPEGV